MRSFWKLVETIDKWTGFVLYIEYNERVEHIPDPEDVLDAPDSSNKTKSERFDDVNQAIESFKRHLREAYTESISIISLSQRVADDNRFSIPKSIALAWWNSRINTIKFGPGAARIPELKTLKMPNMASLHGRSMFNRFAAPVDSSAKTFVTGKEDDSFVQL